MYKEQLLVELQKLNETALVKSIILPLLGKFGYKNVEHRHGTLERGIDILCVKEDELGEDNVLAIQVKKLKFSGNYQAKGQIHNIAHQLEACKTETIDLKDGTQIKANRVWFISPYTMNIQALYSAFSKIKALKEADVRIIDGDKLYELIAQKAPELLLNLGDKGMIYIERFKKEIPILQEALSFKIKDKEHLSKQYVKMYLSLLPNKFRYLYSGDFQLSRGKEIEQEQNILLESISDLNKVSMQLLGLPCVKVEKDIYNKISVFPLKNNFVPILKKRIKDEISLLKSNLKLSIPSGSKALNNYFNFINEFQKLIKHDAFHYVGSATNNPQEALYFDIEIDQLINSKLNYQIIADAGAGKTTLLRMIGFHSINTNRLPVFIPLVTRTKNQKILDLIRKTCNNLGLGISEDDLIDKLNNGGLIILFDGIDEAISKTKTIQSDILEFVEKYPHTQFILSTRHWAAIKESHLFMSIRVLPFTAEQVNQFFYNWFTSEPSKANEIITHLKDNSGLYDIVSTPLVATIIAAIKMHGKQLPKDLIDVYNQRLELLLHDWDNMRGVKRDIFDSRDKLIFLRRFAYMLHSKHIRSASWNEMINFAVDNVGEINTKETAASFINELINNNNVIFKDISNKWGLGHLQYQEYLTALELKENSSINKAMYLEDGWWGKVFVNYAYLTRDVSSLIQDALLKNKAAAYIHLLFELISLAPNTDKKLKKYLMDGDGVAKMIKVIRYDESYKLDFLGEPDLEDEEFEFNYKL